MKDRESQQRLTTETRKTAELCGNEYAGARCIKARGHDVVASTSPWGGAQVIKIDWDRGVLIAGSEPRKDGMALGF